MIKKYLGLDLFDLAIHAGVTIAMAVVASSVFPPAHEEVGVGLVFAISFVTLAWRRRLGLREQETRGGEADPQRLLLLEDRVADLEQAQGRVLELEERLDFAERLLTRQRDDSRLPG